MLVNRYVSWEWFCAILCLKIDVMLTTSLKAFSLKITIYQEHMNLKIARYCE